MGFVTPDPPLPPTATEEEMRADLASIRRRIKVNALMAAILMFTGIAFVACFALLVASHA